MFRIYVNGNYLMNSYNAIAMQQIVDQLRDYGWTVLHEVDSPFDVYVYSSPKKIAEEYLLPLEAK